MPDIAPSTISWIGSLQIWLTMMVGLISGRLLDAGYFVPTFLVGAVLEVTGVFLMSLSTQYWQLMLTQGLLTGLGGGIFFTPSLALVTTVRGGIVCGIGNIPKLTQIFAVLRQTPWLGHGHSDDWKFRRRHYLPSGCQTVVARRK